MRLITVDELWECTHTIIDVRAPVEFAKGHIPNAINIPLLNDEERHQVGIQYKELGQRAAVTLGLKLIGPKMSILGQQGVEMAQSHPIVVYCQRGGKRSQSMAWLWSQLGLSVYRLDGGYKSFRQRVLKEFEQPRRLLLLAGKTGVGKTECLQKLQAQMECTLDLECMANHRGSAFGGIDLGSQPTQANFENILAYSLKRMPQPKSIWIESESRGIGQVHLPEALWAQMQVAPRIYLERTRSERVDRLLGEYQGATDDEIEQSLNKVRKRLGPQQYKQSILALQQNDRRSIVEAVLKYYDRTYEFHKEQSADRIVSTMTIQSSYPIDLLIALRRNQDEKSSPIE